MKQLLPSILTGRKGAMAMLLAISVSFSSCYKEYKPDDAAKFIGIWKAVSLSGYTYAQTIVISPGSNAVTVTGAVDIGDAGCDQVVNLNGEANGYNITFPTQTKTDACGTNYEVSLNGQLVNNVLTLTEVVNQIQVQSDKRTVYSTRTNVLACGKL